MAGTITGKHIFYDASLTVNGVDLSNRVERLELRLGTNKQVGAAMGDLQDYAIAGTLTIEDITAEFYADFDTAKVYATLRAAWENRTTFNIVAKASSGAASSTNPAWTIPVFVGSMPVMQGTRGDRHMAPVTFAVAGAYSIATA